MPASNYLANKVLDHMFGNTAWTMPAGVYVALFTVAPTGAGGGTEVVGGAYVRMLVTPSMAAASGAAKLSNVDVSFPVATTAWGTVVAAALFDAATGGNMLVFNPVVTPRAVGINDRVRFVAGTIQAAVPVA